jgi:aminopeptidase
MDFNEKLKNYSNIILTKGISVQDGEKIEIRASIDDAEFARMLMEEAFKLGAENVDIRWIDFESQKIKLQKAPKKIFKEVPEWEIKKYKDYIGDGWSVINLSAPDPEVFKDVDSKLLGEWSQVKSKAFKFMQKKLTSFENKWTIALAASKPWAKKVFPDLNEDEAYKKLWDYIFKCTRVDRENYKELWENHVGTLKSKYNYLTNKGFVKFRYEGPGTNLEVGMIEKGKWFGAVTKGPNNVDVMPNIPTEEICTSPNKYMTNGRVQSTMPLVYNGNVIKDLWFEFKEGKVVDFGASEGEELMGTFLDTDEGAKYLGEVALVPVNTPIYQLDTLFYNTLYDENASCHLALGDALPMCLEGGVAEMSDEDKDKIGFNESTVHLDFMIGSEDLNIVGVLPNGEEEYIFKNGKWA